jgi:hypothetical protein
VEKNFSLYFLFGHINYSCVGHPGKGNAPRREKKILTFNDEANVKNWARRIDLANGQETEGAKFLRTGYKQRPENRKKIDACMLVARCWATKAKHEKSRLTGKKF